jgi:hypothetical protein
MEIKFYPYCTSTGCNIDVLSQYTTQIVKRIFNVYWETYFNCFDAMLKTTEDLWRVSGIQLAMQRDIHEDDSRVEDLDGATERHEEKSYHCNFVQF